MDHLGEEHAGADRPLVPTLLIHVPPLALDFPEIEVE
jgi:hypothetical protein